VDLVQLKDGNFFAFLASANVPVMATFFTRTSKPALEELETVKELAEEYKGVVEFVIVDADEAQKVVDELGILCVPTILLFHRQKVLDRFVGLISRESLAERLEEDLKNLGKSLAFFGG